MTPRARVQSVRRVRRVILWMGILGLLLPVSLAWTAAIGDQVELHARNRAGVPFHHYPQGTHEFQRVPDGTRAKEGREPIQLTPAGHLIVRG
jgi:hypothetical protein